MNASTQPSTSLTAWDDIKVEYSCLNAIGEFDFAMPPQAISVAFAPHERVTWIETWIQLWANDGVQEMPYSPPGPTRIEGKTAIYRHYSSLPDAYSSMTFPDLKIYPMLDPNWLLAEYRGEIDIAATNRAYNNYYCALFHLRDGLIVLFKEYSNPIILSEAFGDTSSLGATFNLSEN